MYWLLLFLPFPVLTEDEHSPNDNSRGATSTEYSANAESEMVKSEANQAATAAAAAAAASAESLALATSTGEDIIDRSASSVASADYAMQRYNSSAGNYNSDYAASQYVQSYYGASGAASATGMYPMTPLGAPFLYPHLYSAGHHASGLHHQGQDTGLVDDYATAASADARAGTGGAPVAETDPTGQHAAAYSQLGGEDESQTGPIRGGYLKSEHGVWRPYWRSIFNNHTTTATARRYHCDFKFVYVLLQLRFKAEFAQFFLLIWSHILQYYYSSSYIDVYHHDYLL